MAPTRCCCFQTLKSASLAAGMFTLVTSTLQLLAAVAVYIGYAEYFIKYQRLESLLAKPNETTTSMYAGQQPTIGILYIALAGADMLFIFVSLIMIFGIEAIHPRRIYFYPWIVFYPLYMVYESAINIYYFFLSFSARNNQTLSSHKTSVLFTEQSTYLGFLVVPLVYWAVKEIFIMIFWFVVINCVKSIEKQPLAPGSAEAGAKRASPLMPPAGPYPAAGYPQFGGLPSAPLGPRGYAVPPGLRLGGYQAPTPGYGFSGGGAPSSYAPPAQFSSYSRPQAVYGRAPYGIQ